MNKAVGFLKAQTSAGSVTGTGLIAKVVMALDAAGKNPRHFGGHNLLKEIESTRGQDGRYGNLGRIRRRARRAGRRLRGRYAAGGRLDLARRRAVP